MDKTQLGQLVAAVKGEFSGGAPGIEITGVCTDSRVVKPGDVFFALVAERDGHEFVEEAIRGGAAAVVVSSAVKADVPVVMVPDTLVALGDFAREYRAVHSIPVVAVTGSVGKTTTKEMIAAVLAGKYNVLKNDMNFNNEIGLPLTLFGLDQSHTAAVLEMAMRGPGEIRRLADIARPRIGVITNVGMSHIELLESRDAIATAKSELLDELPTDGLAVINADDDYCEFMKARRYGRTVLFGMGEAADIRATTLKVGRDGTPSATVTTVRGTVDLHLSAVGAHNMDNAMAALAVGLEMGVTLEDAKSALEKVCSPSMRCEVTQSQAGYTVIDDAYNANPASMSSAIRTLVAMDGRMKIAVLGDMLELGEYARDAHVALAKQVAEENLDRLVTVGSLGRVIAEAAVDAGMDYDRVMTCDTSSEVAAELKPELGAGDIVLVKGSRGMKMEIVVEGLLRE